MLKSIVLMSKNVERTSNFYSEVVGLKMVHQTEKYAELKARDLSLQIKQSPSLAHSTYGYSPILSFELGVN